MQLRHAFLASSYGTPSQRFGLTAHTGRPRRLFASGERWAILTAHNQHGVRQEPAHNERQQRLLEQSLSGFVCQAAVNGEGEWAEASLLVRGITLRQARDLGNQFAQAAVLWGSGQRAALVWCGPEGSSDQTGFSSRVERFWVCPSGATHTFSGQAVSVGDHE